ncbi:MAG: hypothetical protein ACR2RL_21780 [Gammaproteobacteria bacterium]
MSTPPEYAITRARIDALEARIAALEAQCGTSIDELEARAPTRPLRVRRRRDDEDDDDDDDDDDD